MGLSASTQSAIPVVEAAKNPDENIVVIPVDASKQAELAFNCLYLKVNLFLK